VKAILQWIWCKQLDTAKSKLRAYEEAFKEAQADQFPKGPVQLSDAQFQGLYEREQTRDRTIMIEREMRDLQSKVWKQDDSFGKAIAEVNRRLSKLEQSCGLDVDPQKPMKYAQDAPPEKGA